MIETCGEGLGVGEKLEHKSAMCILSAQANCVLGCTQRSMASRSRERVLLLYFALERPYVEY